MSLQTKKKRLDIALPLQCAESVAAQTGTLLKGSNPELAISTTAKTHVNAEAEGGQSESDEEDEEGDKKGMEELSNEEEMAYALRRQRKRDQKDQKRQPGKESFFQGKFFSATPEDWADKVAQLKGMKKEKKSGLPGLTPKIRNPSGKSHLNIPPLRRIILPDVAMF